MLSRTTIIALQCTAYKEDKLSLNWNLLILKCFVRARARWVETEYRTNQLYFSKPYRIYYEYIYQKL